MPLFAFPLLRVGTRPLDLATVFAAAFAAASLPALLRVRGTGRRRTALAFAILAALVPLAALLPPRPSSFSTTAFLSSEAHWVLVTGFFAAALALRPDALWSRRFVTAHLAAGCAVALFALYQVVGSPRGWPGAGPLLVSFQRGPFRFTPIGATFRGGGYMRPTSVFLEPAWMGGYLAWIVAVALLAPSSDERGRGATALRWSAGVLGVAAVAASVSWGAYADLAAVLVTAAVWRASRGARFSSARRFAAGVTAALLVLALALATPPGRRVAAAVGERLTLLRSTAAGETESGADTPQVRLRNAEHAWNLFVENPWKGIGLGQFGRYAWDIEPVKPGTVPGAASFADSLSRRDPWFGWLTIAAEAGVAGPLVLAVAAGIAAFRARGRSAGLVAALAALAVVQQIHTGSYIDLWWWYPLSLAAVLGSRAGEPPVGTARA